MDLHGNAALSWNGRRLLAERVVVEGWTLAAAAEAAGVSARCARKWVGRYRAGDRELRDRSSAPGRVWNRTDAGRVAVIMKLRRLRMTAAEIAETLAMPLSTVSGILTRSGLGRLGRIGLEAARRYERSRPGELVHVDVKKPGRIVGAGRRANRSRDAAMIDTDRLGAILDEYDSDPHTELLALIAAKARLRRGADPMEVLAVMEGIHDRGSEPRRPSQMAGLEARNVQRQGAWGRRRCDGGDARHNWWRKAHSLMRRMVDRESPRPGLSVPIAYLETPGAGSERLGIQFGAAPGADRPPGAAYAAPRRPSSLRGMGVDNRQSGADAALDGVPGRPGRALIGWMGEADAGLALAARQPELAGDAALAARARAARAAVVRRPPGLDQGDLVRPLPPALAAHAARLARDEQSAVFLKEGWRIQMVDLRRVCALQPTLQSENAVERVRAADAGDVESIAAITLPESGVNQRTPVQYDEAHKTWLLSGGNANLRLDGPFAGDVGGRKAVGFFVALGSSFLQVARHHGRYVLRDGYHRSFGLLARGIAVVPACVRDFGAGDLGVSAAMFGPDVYLGERPPVLADFLDDAVAADVKIPIVQKLIVVQALELAPMS